MKILRWQVRQLVSSANFWSMAFSPLGLGWTIFSVGLQTRIKVQIEPYAHLLWYLIPAGMLLGAYLNWPKRSISRNLPNMDTEVEVRVGDIFASKSPIVVTVPTTLETEFDNHAIDRRSIQGQFTTKYFGSPENLSKALLEAASKSECLDEVANFYSEGQLRERFPQGEIFVCRGNPRLGYLTTFTNFNDHGNAIIKESEFYEFLPKLWLGIRERGATGSVDVPLLGAGFGRLNLPNRRDILRELIQSFSAASADARLVDKVTFYVTPADFAKWRFSFEFIERLLENICDDHNRRPRQTAPVGKQVD